MINVIKIMPLMPEEFVEMVLVPEAAICLIQEDQ